MSVRRRVCTAAGPVLGIWLGVGACSSSEPVVAADSGPDGAGDGSTVDDRRCVDFEPQRRAFFGDTHVHTALSLDANLQGTRLRPLDAYRFARGERVGIQPYDAEGEPLRSLQLARPLDFAVVSDHAEFLGHVVSCNDPAFAGFDSETCKAYRDNPRASFIQLNAATAAQQGQVSSPDPCPQGQCEEAVSSAWAELQQAAAAAQDESDRCEFTSFVGYEWTGNPGTRNLHRNVIFASDVVPDRPTSYFDVSQEEQLWEALSEQCERDLEGCEVLTIPHNSNLSAGLMFEQVRANGEPFDRAYAEQRARMEPLVEIFQHKGSSECLSPMGSDEDCSFELMPYNTLGSANLGGDANELVQSDFVRDALLQGLRLRDSLGVNPYAYGFIASTDTHIGAPGAVEEDNFPGHGGAGRPARDRIPPGLVDQAWFNPGGLAVLWAEQNTRAALFAAMRRREAYATSGTRIQLRFFGGFGLDAGLCAQGDRIETAYKAGVPMGGELESSTAAGRLAFLVDVQRDPGTSEQPGTPLSHVQIVKGWLEDGQLRTRVIDVAGDPASAASVDPNTCERSGAGADELCTVWRDEQFDPAQLAFYYVRAFENPSCRWTGYACQAANVNCDEPATITTGLEPCCDDAYPKTQRERAWSSPIWLLPGG